MISTKDEWWWSCHFWQLGCGVSLALKKPAPCYDKMPDSKGDLEFLVSVKIHMSCLENFTEVCLKRKSESLYGPVQDLAAHKIPPWPMSRGGIIQEEPFCSQFYELSQAKDSMNTNSWPS